MPLVDLGYYLYMVQFRSYFISCVHRRDHWTHNHKSISSGIKPTVELYLESNWLGLMASMHNHCYPLQMFHNKAEKGMSNIWNEQDMEWARYGMSKIWNEQDMEWARYGIGMSKIWNEQDLKWVVLNDPTLLKGSGTSYRCSTALQLHASSSTPHWDWAPQKPGTPPQHWRPKPAATLQRSLSWGGGMSKAEVLLHKCLHFRDF